MKEASTLAVVYLYITVMNPVKGFGARVKKRLTVQGGDGGGEDCPDIGGYRGADYSKLKEQKGMLGGLREDGRGGPEGRAERKMAPREEAGTKLTQFPTVPSTATCLQNRVP